MPALKNSPRILLLAENDHEREAYAAVLRNRGIDIETTEDGTLAGLLLQKEQITSILILSSATQAASRELLRIRALHFPSVPVFFAAAASQTELETLLSSTGITMLPQAPQATDLEALVEADAAGRSTSRPPQRLGIGTIWLSKAEYPLLFRDARAKFEAEFIKRLLRRYRGNVSKVSRAMDMARRNVQIKIKQYNIDLGEYRDELDEL